MSQVVLPCVLQNPLVTVPLIGASKPQHLGHAVAELALKLSPEDIAALERAYRPRAAVT